jgi:hypothetical protein
MIPNYEELKQMDIVKLREIAKAHNVPVHHASGAEKIAKAIMEKFFEDAKPKAVEEQHPLVKPTQPVFHNTEEEVRTAVESITSKEGYSVNFPGDNTVIFKFKGAEESCNLDIPLRVIKQKAQNVARGRIAPRSLGTDGQYKGYADTILVG